MTLTLSEVEAPLEEQLDNTYNTPIPSENLLPEQPIANTVDYKSQCLGRHAEGIVLTILENDADLSGNVKCCYPKETGLLLTPEDNNLQQIDDDLLDDDDKKKKKTAMSKGKHIKKKMLKNPFEKIQKAAQKLAAKAKFQRKLRK